MARLTPSLKMAMKAYIAGSSDTQTAQPLLMGQTAMRYPGGKGAAGVYQAIVNQIPPHEVYIETHLGGGAVLERKRAARRSIGVDADAVVVEAWAARDWPGLELHHGDAAEFLAGYRFTGAEFVYADPPYVMAARRSRRRYYRREYDDAAHERLLAVLAKLPCAVMVSGYASELYANSPLSTWRQISFQAVTRGGASAAERLWMNYPDPEALHDYKHLGTNFRERERIKRKRLRWRNRLTKLDPLERVAILECLRELDAGGSACSITGNGDAGLHR